MKPGFYIIMAAQFFSSLADNALLVAAIELLLHLHGPEWMTPLLKFFFTVSYVVLAAVRRRVRRLDAERPGDVHYQRLKIGGCLIMFFYVGSRCPACPST